jgi:pimeloyl-ACP methyl ester carboxylesterase
MINQANNRLLSAHSLPYLDTGLPYQEAETVVILHGLFGGLSNFESVIEQLQSRFRVVMPFFPLFSRDGFQHLSDLCAHTIQFLNDLHLHEPVHLIGNSLGGQLALMVCLNQPNRVNSLVLTGSAGIGEQEFGCSSPKRHCKNYLKDRIQEVFFDYSLDDAYVEEIHKVLVNHNQLIRLLKLARNSKNTPLINDLKFIDCDVLLIWGKNDSITPPEVAHIFNTELQKSRLILLEACGHAPMTEHPKLFHFHLNDFYTQITSKNDKDYSYVSSHHSFRSCT